MVIEGDLTWGGEHTIQYKDDVSLNCTPETYKMLLTNITPINSIYILNCLSLLYFRKTFYQKIGNGQFLVG